MLILWFIILFWVTTVKVLHALMLLVLAGAAALCLCLNVSEVHSSFNVIITVKMSSSSFWGRCLSLTGPNQGDRAGVQIYIPGLQFSIIYYNSSPSTSAVNLSISPCFMHCGAFSINLDQI